MARSRFIKYQHLILMVFLALVPSTAMALAGIGEHDSTFHYNKYTKVKWQHPGQFCSRDGETSDLHCFEFARESYEDFEGLERSLEEINVPFDESSPYIIARRSDDSKWLVYDLEKEQPLITGVAYKEALAVWQSLGLLEPDFIDTINPHKFLRETAASKKRRLRVKFALWAFPTLILAVFFGALATEANREYKKEGLKKYLILSRLLMFLTGLAALIALAGIGFARFT